MDHRHIGFANAPWEPIAIGARQKRVETADSVLRLVELSPGFVEGDWCRKAHVGYVVSGSLAIEFRDGLLRYREGDGLGIRAGEESEHKAVVTEAVTLFLVEPC